MSGRKSVSYFYNEEVGNYYYGPGHPMKPHRIRMAHTLVLTYGLYREMNIFRPALTSAEDMSRFHADDYISFLQTVNPDNESKYKKDLTTFNADVDCPVFDGLFRFCQIYTGGSVGGAYKLNRGQCDVAINWSGGLHHAKKAEASGFCYVNDIVLAILELLKYHSRVLYIDIDIHHGDGVEEAFYTTDRVMTVSFHKFGEYFPGTGGVEDTGHGPGKGYAINYPLLEGIDDDMFVEIFKSVISSVREKFRPGAIVLQCGADSLAGDRLGVFNLSVKGHGQCVDFVRSFNVPTLVLGGGGYTVRNVSRCWAHETGVVLGRELDNQIPYNEYYGYYGPDFKLHITPSNMENRNDADYIQTMSTAVMQILHDLPAAPSVQYKVAARDPDLEDSAAAADDARNPDERVTQSDRDAAQHDGREFYASEKDQDNENGTKGAPSSNGGGGSSEGGHAAGMTGMEID